MRRYMVLCESCTSSWFSPEPDMAHICPACGWLTSVWEFYTEEFPELEFPEKD